jgi:hypothetical protein
MGEEPAIAFLEALDDLGLKRALATPSRADDAIEVAKMRLSLTSGKLAGLTLAELAERARAVGRVYVTTMTASKGLEFDVIVMVGVEEGKIPFSPHGQPSLKRTAASSTCHCPGHATQFTSSTRDFGGNRAGASTTTPPVDSFESLASHDSHSGITCAWS